MFRIILPLLFTALLTTLGCRSGSDPAAEVPTAAGPILLRLDPMAGPVGTPVTLTLRGADAAPSLAFGAIPAPLQPLGGDRFLAVVPPGAATGPMTLTVGVATLVSPQPFRVTASAPGLRVDSISPPMGGAGTRVTLRGSGLAAVTAVTLSGQPARWTVNSDLELETTVPEGADPLDRFYLRAPNDGFAASPWFLDLAPRPAVIPVSMVPAEGPEGTQVTLRFRSEQGAFIAFFGETAVDVAVLPPDEDGNLGALATVPRGARSGTVRLAFRDGGSAFPEPFKVLVPAPTLARVDPARGSPGTVVRLTGTGFDRGLSVTFGGGVAATPLIPPTATTALVQVPGSARPGPLILTTDGGSATSRPFQPVPGPPQLDLALDGLWLIQATQTPDRSVPLIQGRDAYLRVRVLANHLNATRPLVRIHLTDAAGVEAYAAELPALGAGTATEFAEGILESTWNLLLPGALIQPGMGLWAEVDPDAALAEADRGNNRFPADGSLPLDVRSLPPLALTLYPIYLDGLLGNVDGPGRSLDSWLGPLRKMLPVRQVEIRKGAILAIDPDPGGDFSGLVNPLERKRIVEGTGLDRFHIGVLDLPGRGGIAGAASIGVQGTLSYGSAVVWDKEDFTGATAYVNRGTALAHELGHLLGRPHSPAGGPSYPDPAYPYARGGIGSFGLDLETLTLQDPASCFDVMGYRSPVWISDWSFKHMLDFRAATPTPDRSAARDCLLVTGLTQTLSRRAYGSLDQVFRVQARPLMPTPGEFLLEGLDAAGTVLLTTPFGGRSPFDPPEGEFADVFAVPLDPDSTIQTLRVTRRGRILWEIAAPAVASDPATVARILEPGRVRLTWDAAAYPGLLVRDARNGEVIGNGRSGSLDLLTDAPLLDLDLSNGFSSLRRRLPVQ